MINNSYNTIFFAIWAILIVCLGIYLFVYIRRLIQRDKKHKEFEGLINQQDVASKLLIRRDIELSKANDTLLDLDRRKSEFVSIVAHQLRTPLSGIKWTLSLMLDGDVGALTNDQKDLLQKTYKSNERMIALVEDMLYVDRLESGKNPVIYEPAEILPIIDDVLFDLYPKVQAKNIAIQFEKREQVPAVSIDKEKIRAVIQNIVENAVKYSNLGGSIFISIYKDAKKVFVTVRDTGIGIPEDQKRYLFSKFFRAKNAMKKETDGTGLGLFIVKNIIDKHGGDMWCESTEGKGTTIGFSINI